MIDYDAVVSPLRKVGDEEGELVLNALAGVLQNWAQSFLERARVVRAREFSFELDKANKSLPAVSARVTGQVK